MIKEIMAVMIIYQSLTGISSQIVTLKQCQEAKKEYEKGEREGYHITCIELKQKEGAK